MLIPERASDVIDAAIDAAHGCGMIRDGQIASQLFPLDLDRDDEGFTPLEKRYWAAVKRLARLIRREGPLYFCDHTYMFGRNNILTICEYYVEGALDAEFVEAEA